MILSESFEKTEALVFKRRIWPMAMDLPQLGILLEMDTWNWKQASATKGATQLFQTET